MDGVGELGLLAKDGADLDPLQTPALAMLDGLGQAHLVGRLEDRPIRVLPVDLPLPVCPLDRRLVRLPAVCNVRDRRRRSGPVAVTIASASASSRGPLTQVTMKRLVRSWL
jgi:hypothetical protein